jgi:hypothetical protein
MTPFTYQLLINLTFSILIFLLQIPKRLLCLILNKISIYLPFNNQDIETIKKLKHEKNQNRGIVRSCDFNEFISILKDDSNDLISKSYSQIDMFLYFFLCSIILIIIKLLFLKDDLTNIANGFGFACIIYSIWCCLDYIKKEKNRIKLLIGIILCFILYMFITIYYKEFWSINEKEIIETSLNYIDEITKKEVFKDFNNTNISLTKNQWYNKYLNPLNLNIFFGFIFSFILSIIYIIIDNIYYFDINLIKHSKNKVNTQLKLIENLTKGKIILNTFLLFGLIQPLFKGYFPNLDLKIYKIVMLSTAFLELMFNTQSIWYDTLTIEQNNYELSLDFCQTQDSDIKKQLPSLKVKIMFINKKLIDCLFKLIFLSFSPFLLCLLYFYNTKDKINNTLLQSIIYIILITFAIGKGIIYNGKVIYYGLIKRK